MKAESKKMERRKAKWGKWQYPLAVPPCFMLLSAFLFSSFLLLFSSCKPDDPIKPDLPDDDPIETTTQLNIVWKRVFYEEKYPNYFNDPIFWGDYVIVSNSHGNEPGTELGIRVLHKATGEDHPIWNHEPGGIVDPGDAMDCIHIGGESGNTLFSGDNFSLYAINLNTGARLWKTTLRPDYNGYNRFSMYGDSPVQIYYPRGSALSKSWCRLAKCDLQTGAREDLVEIHIEDDYDFHLRPSAWMVAGNGDSLLLFLSSGWNFSLVKGMMKAYCYNVTKKEMVWEKRDFVEGGDASKHIPLIVNNSVIFMGISNVHCFDIATGELLWQYIANEGYSDTPPLYRDGKLYIRSTGGIVTCLDAQTGSVVWKTGSSYIPAPDGRMDIYDGKLYFAAWGPDVTFHLYCLDANTGRKLWSDRGPVNSIVEGVIIDQELGYLYCMSTVTIFCVDLKNTPVRN